MANETKFHPLFGFGAGQFDSACDKGKVPRATPSHTRSGFRPPKTEHAKREISEEKSILSASKFGQYQGRPLQEDTAIGLARPTLPARSRIISTASHHRTDRTRAASRACNVRAAKQGLSGWPTSALTSPQPFQVALLSSFEPPPPPPPPPQNSHCSNLGVLAGASRHIFDFTSQINAQ